MGATNPGQESSDPAISGAAFVQPQPQAVLGISSSAVYGTAFTSSIPQSFQVATGGLFKLVLDPAGFAAAFPEVKDGVGGAALGGYANILSNGVQGNVQVTLGTLANISMGMTYDIHIGDKIQPHTGNLTGMRVASFIAGGILAVAVLLFQILYDMTPADDAREDMVVKFELLVQLIVATLITLDVLFYQLDEQSKGLYQKLFAADIAQFQKAGWSDTETKVGMAFKTLVGSLTVGALLGAAIVPPILDSIGEKKLDHLLTGNPSKSQPGAGQGAYISVSQQDNS